MVLDEQQVSGEVISHAQMPSIPFPAVSRSEDASIPHDESAAFFGMPIGHRTNTSSLFTLSQLRKLVGIFPEDYFFLLEARRSIPESISLRMSPISNSIPQLDRTVTDELVKNFFTLVHPWHPILDREQFRKDYNAVINEQPTPDQRSALCLVVFALGAIASKPMRSNGLLKEEIPGAAFFEPAIHILVAAWMQSFDNDILLSQGLVLSAIYYMYLLRPLQGWRLIHMASTTIQQILTRSSDLDEVQQQAIARVCWTCFLIEWYVRTQEVSFSNADITRSDNLADFDHPRSGIEPLVNTMPFPRCGDSQELHMVRFLTQLSVRCLLNRIHHALHFTDNTLTHSGNPLEDGNSLTPPPHMPSSSLFRVCSELERQLAGWYDTLPDSIRPDLHTDLSWPGDPHACILRLRYWSSRFITYRPFVIYATSCSTDRSITQDILTNCEICLSSCRAYVYAASDVALISSPYAYATTQW